MIAAETKKLDDVISGTAEAQGGYICKGQAGKYFIVFDTAAVAMAWAADVQKQLGGIAWDPQVTSSVQQEGHSLVSGASVGIGLHTDAPTMFKYNKVTRRMDYFGQVVNRAARIGALASDGEIAMSMATHDAIPDKTKALYAFESKGSFVLKGVAQGEPQPIMTGQPVELVDRLSMFAKAPEA